MSPHTMADGHIVFGADYVGVGAVSALCLLQEWMNFNQTL